MNCNLHSNASNGNCTSVSVGTSVTTLTYDIENRVVGISYPGGASNSFAYNGEDLRTQKVDSTGTQNYVTDGSSPASAVLKDGNAVYTPGLSEHRGSASKFYHGDALGSTRGITDSTQAVTDSVLYDAFGNTVTRTGSTPTPFGFVGKAQYQSDSDSGLQLLGHRYYDPSIGRFLSRDPKKAGTNWYAYCENNPLTLTDASGLLPRAPKFLQFLFGLIGLIDNSTTKGHISPVATQQVPISGVFTAEEITEEPNPPTTSGQGGGPEPPPPGGSSFGNEPGGVSDPPSRPGGGSFGGGRSSGSGGGMAVPGIIGEGAGAFAQLLGPVAKRKTTIQRAYEMVDDDSPGADPPQHDTYYPGIPRRR